MILMARDGARSPTTIILCRRRDSGSLEKRLFPSFATRIAEQAIGRTHPQSPCQQGYNSDQAGPAPALDGQAIAKRKRNQRQSHDDSDRAIHITYVT